MSIPAGVTAVEVCCLPGSTSLPITQVSVQVTPTVVATWLTNGQSLVSMCNTIPIPGWVMLPAVDQAGFVTAPGQGVTGWGYNVVTNWTLSDGTKGQLTGTIQVFSNQSVVFLASNGSTFTAPSNYPIGGVALNGWVTAYANLPSGLGLSQSGAAYVCQADGRVYVWSGTAWPASGQGFYVGGTVGAQGPAGASAANATAAAPGLVQLAGDLAGTAAAPTVPSKAPLASPTFTGTVSTPALAVSGGTPAAGKVLTSDATGNATWQALSGATTSVAGAVKLAGDLSGTAAAPTVPALANKAPIASPTFTGTVSTPGLAVTAGGLLAGNVLTSDSAGNATWQAPASTLTAAQSAALAFVIGA